MNRLRKALGWVFTALVLVLAVGITFTVGWHPFIGPRARPLTARKFQSTPQRLARGEYLARNVSDCMGCHAEHDWTAHDAPLLPKTFGAGQDMNFLKGFPGKVYAPNITPDSETGTGDWSDDQLARAIREGVSHDGRALFPFMPYLDFRALSDEDLASIIVYLRSLPPVRRQQPKTDLIFPVKYLIRSVPQPLYTTVSEPDFSTPEKRGEILGDNRWMQGLPHAPGRTCAAAAWHGLRRRVDSRRTVGPRGQHQHYSRPIRNFLLRPSHVHPGNPRGFCRVPEAQPDHAMAHLPRNDGRGYSRDVCLC